MKSTSAFVLMLALAASAAAQPPGQRGGPGGPGGPNRETLKVLKQFDQDENGWLDREERAAARKHAEGFQLEAEQVRRAMALLAVTQDGQGFKGAGLHLVNELARQHDCTRVTLGWVPLLNSSQARVVSMSQPSPRT